MADDTERRDRFIPTVRQRAAGRDVELLLLWSGWLLGPGIYPRVRRLHGDRLTELLPGLLDVLLQCLGLGCPGCRGRPLPALGPA